MRAGDLGEFFEWRKDNPKLFQAVVLTLAEAGELITKKPRRAAEICVAASKSKLSVDEIERQIRESVYTTTPTGVMRFADFMHRPGMIPQKPASWKDVFFDGALSLPGN
jgi:NitT/TauT family transport system substrate-binding protein